MKKIILGIVLINLLTACSFFKPKKSVSKPNEEPVATAPATTAETPTVGSAAAADVNAQALANTATGANAATTPTAEEAAKSDTAASAANTAQADPGNDPASALSKRSVHFPFDVDAIQDSDKPTIQAHGEFLGSHLDSKVRAEGNADERGSSEYNLALGQRRANNTKKALVLSGAKATQIEAISYGEEKPMATGHDEASWAQNRRTDLNYR